MKIENVEITSLELEPFLRKYGIKNLNSRVSALIDHQMTSVSGFPTLINHMKAYIDSRFGYQRIKGLDFRIFYNPTRTKNVKANTFTDHDKNFSCFLCNLLPGQRGIKVMNKYMLVVNPGITIPGDLTIPTIDHKLQKLESHFDDMLDIAESLTDYSIYFNGPLAGATCPHFHFQAGLRDKLPAEKQINRILENNIPEYLQKDLLSKSRGTEIFRIKNFLRTNYCIYSSSKTTVQEFAQTFFRQIKLNNQKFLHSLPNIPDFGSKIMVFGETEEEGRFNVMTKYYPDSKKYLAVFFPKIFNRPQVYFEKRPEHLTLGFAIKEALGHVFVTSKTDLYRILNKPGVLIKAYADTNLNQEADENLFNQLKKFC